MNTLCKLALPLVASAGCLLLAAPAMAQSQEIIVRGELKVPEGYEPVTRSVDISDLDLRTDDGEMEMEKRVAAAVKKICWSHPRPARWQVKESEKCDEFAWKSARPQMEDALKEARGG